MKILISIVTSLLAGLTLASTDFSPLHELHNLFVNKRRIFIACGVAVIGFFLVFSGFIMGLVEGSLQFDAQGFMVWSSLFTVAASLAIAGAFCIMGAWAAFPQAPPVRQNIFAELNSQFRLTELAEQFFKELNERADERSEAPPAAEPNREPIHEPTQAEKFSEIHPREEVPSQTLHH
jgi:hypothetical protein